MPIKIIKHQLLLEDIYPAIIMEDYSLRIRFMNDNLYKSQDDHKRLCDSNENTPVQVKALERFYRKDWESYFNSIIIPIRTTS